MKKYTKEQLIKAAVKMGCNPVEALRGLLALMTKWPLLTNSFLMFNTEM